MKQSTLTKVLAIWIGILTILVIVNLSLNLIKEEEKDINEPPVADIWASVGSGFENKSEYTSHYKLWLDASHSSDPDGQLLIISWDFNITDGIQTDSTQVFPVIVFYDIETYKESWKVPNPDYSEDDGAYRYYVPINVPITIKLTVSDGIISNTETINVTVPYIQHP